MELDFIRLFNKKLEEKNIDWEVSALASPDGKLFSLGSDSKLIGRIFELISYNILQEIADENGLILYPSPQQTVYPDFTLMRSEADTEKIAVDIKTTYRKFLKNGQPSGYVFTLGSFAEEDKHMQEYNEYLNHLKEWSDIEKTRREAVKIIEDEIKYISEGIHEDLAPLYIKRDEIASDILEEKKKIIRIYNRFKKPVDDFLNANRELLSGYSICIRSGIVIDTTFQQNVFDYINKQKRNVFKDDNYQLYKTIEELGDIESVEEYLNIPKKIIEKMSEFPDGIIPQIKESKMLDFYNYLFGLGYLTNKYELVSDGKTLDKLSPGERGALLLIFYLLLDLRDIPLVIDQPEDNLDNQSVAKVLVPFIQAAKNRRQIILVTHNPNLAVVADSDQIIHVKIDKENDQLVEVEAGGIEDDTINQSIVTILEGTMLSFKKRELKYIEG